MVPTELGGGPFSVDRALALGVGVNRLRGPELESPFWGVRVPAGMAQSLLDQVNAYAERMSPGAFFSHITAARLWGIPLPFARQRRSGLDGAVAPAHPTCRIRARSSKSSSPRCERQAGAGEVWQTSLRPVDEQPFARSHQPQPMTPYRGTVPASVARIALSFRGERRLCVFVTRESEQKGRGNVFSCRDSHHPWPHADRSAR